MPFATTHDSASDTETSDTEHAAERSTASTLLRFAPLLLGAAALLLLGRLLPFDAWLEAVRGRVEDAGALGPLLYGGFYVAAALFLVPGAAITLAAGAIFGVGVGTAVVSVASTLTAALAFPLARTFLRRKVEGFVAERPKLGAVDQAVTDGGWKVVGLLRLSPAVPFGPLNYLLGVTGVRYAPAVLVSWIAMLPGTLLYVYLGAAGAEAAAGVERPAGQWVLTVLGLAATLVVTVMLTRTARARIAELGLEGESAGHAEGDR
ncbi:MAG: TVP38/TMEM64 family protein [Planctomycetota bacterium]